MNFIQSILQVIINKLNQNEFINLVLITIKMEHLSIGTTFTHRKSNRNGN